MNSRIAIGTTDGVSLCDHLARSAAFIVFEVEDRTIKSRSVRQRDTDQCGNHKTFVEMLEGCDDVICGGIGQGAFDSLRRHGITPVVAAARHGVEEAATLYLEGRLATTGDRVCLCG